MSKEASAGVRCRCGLDIYYYEQHWRHCPEKDKWKPKTKKEDKE